MRVGIRQFLGAVAAMALALHTVAWGIVPASEPASVDPFSVICHNDASAAVDPAYDQSPLAPTHACDHCNLCNVSAPPLPHGTAIAAYATPAPESVPPPIDSPRHDAVVGEPGLARGPPSIA